MNATINHPEGEEAVLRLLKGTVPERRSEIDNLWRKYRPAIHVSEDAPGVAMDATRHRIRFDHKTMRAIWLMGFNGWRRLGLYSPAVVCSREFGWTIDEVLAKDDERGLLELDDRARVEVADRLIRTGDTEAVTWPPGIPEPGTAPGTLASAQDKLTFDLVCMATAFVLLHEFRHVMFAADGDRPASRLDEETACDVWARSFITDRIGDFAREQGRPHHAFLEKRAMAMALGASILHDLTPETARWGTDEYPSIADRIHSMVSGIGPSSDANYWLFAACLLIGIFRRSGRSLPMVVSDSKAFVTDLIEQLR